MRNYTIHLLTNHAPKDKSSLTIRGGYATVTDGAFVVHENDASSCVLCAVPLTSINYVESSAE